MHLIVARIGRAHGLRGEVSVEVRTDVPDERFVPGAVLRVEDGPGRRSLAAAGVPVDLTIGRVRDHNGIVLLTFDEVGDRTTAESLRNVLLEAEVGETSAEEDAWYDHELVGLRVAGPDDETLGEVTAVQRGGAQDLLVVRSAAAGDDRLVPFVKALVPEVDVANGRIVVLAPPGLLEDLPED